MLVHFVARITANAALNETMMVKITSSARISAAFPNKKPASTAIIEIAIYLELFGDQTMDNIAELMRDPETE